MSYYEVRFLRGVESMRKLLLSFLAIAQFAFAVELETKTFEFEYKVVSLRAVCYQTCQWDCEESDFDLFYDEESYQLRQSLRDQGLRITHNAVCDQVSRPGENVAVPYVDEHMTSLAKQDYARAMEIVEDEGATFKAVIYKDVDIDIDAFIDSLLVPDGPDDRD